MSRFEVSPLELNAAAAALRGVSGESPPGSTPGGELGEGETQGAIGSFLSRARGVSLALAEAAAADSGDLDGAASLYASTDAQVMPSTRG